MGWVNNIKITHHRRIRVSHDVEITPYDVRFPWVAIWTVQLLQDLAEITASALLLTGSVSLLTGIVSLALIFLAYSSNMKSIIPQRT